MRNILTAQREIQRGSIKFIVGMPANDQLLRARLQCWNGIRRLHPPAGIVANEAIARLAAEPGRALIFQMLDPERITPQAWHVIGVDKLRKNHGRFRRPKGINEAFHIRDEIPRRRHLQRGPFIYKPVLHINNQQSRTIGYKSVGIVNHPKFRLHNGIVIWHGDSLRVAFSGGSKKRFLLATVRFCRLNPSEPIPMKEHSFSRRNIIKLAGGAAVTAAFTGEAAKKRGAKKGRINQSVVHWCWGERGWEVEDTAKAAKDLGCKSVEIIGPEHWPLLKKHGLTCAIAPNGVEGAPFMRGMNNRDYHEMVIKATKETIDACAKHGVKSVIAFNGFKWRKAEDPKSGEISLEEGAKNCVEGFKKIIGHAEKKGVNICLEHLNTRDDTHPMKGHPGYQGDKVDYVADIIRRVGSPNMKMLFDIYHVQIMDGDVIRRLEENKDIIGHIHTAGNPGRKELDDTQEINYPPIMRKLLDIKYKGFVGQEFIPVGDPMKGLIQAVELCDV